MLLVPADRFWQTKSSSMSWSPEPGATGDWAADLDDEAGRARPWWIEVHSIHLARAASGGLCHPGPLDSEASVGTPKCAPCGVLLERHSDARSLHPAITSRQVSPKRGLAPFESPRRPCPVLGAFAIVDQVSAQPSPRTEHGYEAIPTAATKSSPHTASCGGHQE